MVESPLHTILLPGTVRVGSRQIFLIQLSIKAREKTKELSGENLQPKRPYVNLIVPPSCLENVMRKVFSHEFLPQGKRAVVLLLYAIESEATQSTKKSILFQLQ